MSKRKKAVYVGIFLTEGSQSGLKTWAGSTLGPALFKMHAHHATLAFRPSKEEMAKFIPLMGKTISMHISSSAADQKCQCVGITGVNQEDRDIISLAGKKNPHVTISCGEGISPVVSNEMLETQAIPVQTPNYLIGTMGIFTGSECQFDLKGTIYSKE